MAQKDGIKCFGRLVTPPPEWKKCSEIGDLGFLEQNRCIFQYYENGVPIIAGVKPDASKIINFIREPLVLVPGPNKLKWKRCDNYTDLPDGAIAFRPDTGRNVYVGRNMVNQVGNIEYKDSVWVFVKRYESSDCTAPFEVFCKSINQI